MRKDGGHSALQRYHRNTRDESVQKRADDICIDWCNIPTQQLGRNPASRVNDQAYGKRYQISRPMTTEPESEERNIEHDLKLR
jgi:hypothetical protein